MFWKFWFLSGILDEYVDIDYDFWIVWGHLHIKYGGER